MRFSLKQYALATMIFGLSWVAGCAGLSDMPFTRLSNLSNTSFKHIDDSIAKGKPLELYRHIAGNIKNCWLKKPEPFMIKHAVFAQATPTYNRGESQAVITLNKLTKEGGKGKVAFKVEFIAIDRAKTNVKVDNILFAEPTARKLRMTIRYWSTGKLDCDMPAPKDTLVSVPSGVKIKPVKSQ